MSQTAARPMLPGMSCSRFQLGAVLGVNQTLSWGMTFYLPAIIAGPAAESFGQTPFRILAAFSWSLLVSGFCAPHVGRWIDRHGGRGSLLASIVVMAVGLALLATGPNLAIWFLGWTIIGAGMAMGLYDAAFATAGGLLGQEAGPVITGITLVAGFASTLFWTLGSLLIGSLGWRGLLLAYAGIMLLINLPMVWLLVPRAPPRVRAAEASGPRPPGHARTVALVAGFFAIRWFLT
ncbi:MAG TPA: MFS transporter, partial [Rhodopila sp.]|nr:MFS transporter [Rhodopila sp.]